MNHLNILHPLVRRVDVGQAPGPIVARARSAGAVNAAASFQ